MDVASESRVVFVDAETGAEQTTTRREHETVLDALIRVGTNAAFSCRRGTCQVCVLRAVDGDPGPAARVGLSDEAQALGWFLPCKAQPEGPLVVTKPDLDALTIPAHVIDKTWRSDSVVQLRLLPESTLSWRAGQFVTLTHPSGAQRSYSIASTMAEDDALELHVRRVAGGLVSGWLGDEVEVGAVLPMRGPSGACFYDPDSRERPLLLVAGGTGLAPLLGIVRDALAHDHRGPIQLVHGSTRIDGLYADDTLAELATAHPNLSVETWLDDPSEPLPPGCGRGSVVDAAFARGLVPSGAILYLAGPPAMVYEARYRAVLAGVARADIHADPFEDARPTMPDDKAKLARIQPDPELWAALESGPGLTRILTDFYAHAFADPRLAPFFHNVSRQRAIEKQYEFLSDVFTGSGHYFGARPFNAHHWMVISDELFDYREAQIDAAIRRYGLAEHLHRRWSAIHELFRREIVKTHRRGLIMDGVEQRDAIEERTRDEVLELDSICDACFVEVRAGTTVRHQLLTGRVVCLACASG